MEVITNHSRLEHFYLQLYLIPRSKALWIMGFLLWAYLSYATFSSRELSGDVVCTFCTLLSVSIVSSIGATLIMLALIVIGIFASVFFAGFLPGFLCEHKFILKDDGLFEATDVNETLTKWKAIRSIKRHKKYIIVRVGAGLHSLPRKCFNHQEHYEEFGTQLYESWKANK